MHRASTDVPEKRQQGGVRPSQVRAVLSQAALHMHLPDSRMGLNANAPCYNHTFWRWRGCKSAPLNALPSAQLSLHVPRRHPLTLRPRVRVRVRLLSPPSP